MKYSIIGLGLLGLLLGCSHSKPMLEPRPLEGHLYHQTRIQAPLCHTRQEMDVWSIFEAWFNGDLKTVQTQLCAPRDHDLSLYASMEWKIERGHYGQAIETAQTLICHHPKSALASTAWLRLDDLDITGRFYERIQEMLLNAQCMPKTPWARLIRAELLEKWKAYKAQTGVQISQRSGVIDQWAWVGPFGHTAFGDFGQKWEPEDDEILKKVYKVLGAERKIQIQDRISKPSPKLSGVYYLESHLQVEQGPLELWMSIQWNGDGILWIDGKKRAMRSIDQGYAPMEQGYALTLSKGTHVFRVKLSIVDARTPFKMVLVPKDPALENRIRILPWEEKVQMGKCTQIETLPLYPKISNQWPKDFRLWFQAKWMKRHGAFAEVYALLKQMKHKDWTLAEILYGQTLRNDTSKSPNKAIKEAMRAYDRVLSIDAQAAHVLLLKAYVEYIHDRYVQALHWIDRGLIQAPESYLMNNYKAEIFAQLGWEDMAHSIRDLALSLHPIQCALTQQALRAKLSLLEYPDPKTIPIELEYCESLALEVIREIYLAREQWSEALGLLDKTLKHARTQTEALKLEKAHLLSLLKRSESEILKALPQTIRGDLWAIDWLLSHHRRNEAEKRLKSALKRHPTSMNLLKLQAYFEQKPLFSELRIDGLSLIQKEVASSHHYAKAAYFLLDYGAFVYYPNGAHLWITHQIIRVLNKDGIQHFGEVYIPSDAWITQLRTVKSDGKTIFEPEEIPHKNTISMPNLEVGDFIEYEYIQSAGEDPYGYGHWRAPRWYFQLQNAPLMHSEVVYVVPKHMPLEIDIRGDVPKPKVEDHGDWTYYRYWVDQSEPPKPEPLAPPSLEQFLSIQVAHGMTWEEQFAFYTHHLRRITRPSAEMAQWLDKMVKAWDALGLDTRQRVLFLYKEIQKEVKNNGDGLFNKPAAWIWNQRQGSPLAVLITFLEMIEVPHHLVLVKAKGQPLEDGPIPNMDFYQSAVLRVELPDGNLWLSPSDQYMPSDYLSPNLQGQPAWILSSDGLKKIQTPKWDSALEANRVTFDLFIDAQGNAQVQALEHSNGYRAVNLRALFKKLEEDKYRAKRMLNQYLEPYFRQVDLEAYKTHGLEEQGPFEWSYRFEISHFFQKHEAGLTLLQPIYANFMLKNFAPLAQRTWDVVIYSNRQSQITTRFHLNPSKPKLMWKKVPQDLEITSPFGHYRRKVLLEAQTLTIVEETQLFEQRISPERYSEFRSFCQAVDRGQIFDIQIQVKAH